MFVVALEASPKLRVMISPIPVAEAAICRGQLQQLPRFRRFLLSIELLAPRHDLKRAVGQGPLEGSGL